MAKKDQFAVLLCQCARTEIFTVKNSCFALQKLALR